MTQANHPNRAKARWTASSRVTLAIAIGMLLLSAIELVYRGTLPTDGWSVTTESPDSSSWVYGQNLVGAPSLLRENDLLLAVEGQTLRGQAMVAPVPPPANWAAGRNVTVAVLRAGQQVSFPIPVVHWTSLAWWRYGTANLDLFTSGLGALVLVLTGFYTCVRRPDLPSARCLLLLCAAIGAMNLSGMLPDGLSVQYDRLVFWPVAFFNYAIYGTFLAPAVLAFALYFPQPKRLVRRRPWLGIAPFAVGLGLLLALALGAPEVIGWIATPVMILAALAALVHSAFTQRDAVSVAQMRWAVWGAALGLTVALLTFPAAFGWIRDPLLQTVLGDSGIPLGFTILGVSLAVAVSRYRLWGIDVIINRTLVYVPLTAIVAGIFSAVIALSQKAFIAWTGQDSLASTLLATLIVVAAFNPIKDRVQRVVDRVFKETPDPGKRLQAFQERLRTRISAVALAPVTRQLVEEAVAAFDAEGGIAYLEEHGSLRPINTTGEWQGKERMSVSVKCSGARIAQIALGARRSGRAYTDLDRETLEQVAQTVGQAIEEDGNSHRSPGLLPPS
jgi:hypothetical protein